MVVAIALVTCQDGLRGGALAVGSAAHLRPIITVVTTSQYQHLCICTGNRSDVVDRPITSADVALYTLQRPYERR